MKRLKYYEKGRLLSILISTTTSIIKLYNDGHNILILSYKRVLSVIYKLKLLVTIFSNMFIIQLHSAWILRVQFNGGIMSTIFIPKAGGGSSTPGVKGDPGAKGDKGDPGKDGGAGIVYSPPMSPITMNQNDEVIISHPAVTEGIQRNVNIWQQVSETGLTNVLSDFDLADESQYIFEDRNTVNLNGELSLKMTGAPIFGGVRMDMRDGVRYPNGNADTTNEWCLFNDINGNCQTYGTPVTYASATRAGLYYTRTAANDSTAYTTMTIPSDLPAGLYDMYIYGRGYDVIRNYWVSFIKNDVTKYNYPSVPEDWSTISWYDIGKNHSLSPGDTLKFVRPDNGGADMGGVNFAAINIVPAGSPIPTEVPPGNTGTIRSYSNGSYYPNDTYVITPAIEVDLKRILKINSVTHDAVLAPSNTITALVSFDDGATWKYKNTDWVTVTAGTLREKLNAHKYSLTDVLNWMSNYVCSAGEKIRFALNLKTTVVSTTPRLSTLTVNFDHKNSYKIDTGLDYAVSVFDQTNVVVTKLTSGSKLTIIEVELDGGVSTGGGGGASSVDITNINQAITVINQSINTITQSVETVEQSVTNVTNNVNTIAVGNFGSKAICMETLIKGRYVSLFKDGSVMKLRHANAALGYLVNGYLKEDFGIGTEATYYNTGTNPFANDCGEGQLYLDWEYPGRARSTPPALKSGFWLQEIGIGVSPTEHQFQLGLTVQLR